MEYILQEAISSLTLRAEKMDSEVLCETFVDVGSLLTLLCSNNNHVLFGRRGTGKTHILEYLRNKLEQQGHCAVYLDLRTIGSIQSIYQDSSIPLQQRAARMMIDVAEAINLSLSKFVMSDDVRAKKLSPVIEPVLHEINEKIRTINIEGQVVSKEVDEKVSKTSSGTCLGLGINKAYLNADIKNDNQCKSTQSIVREGRERVYIHFPSISQLYGQIVDVLDGKRLIFIIDEFSELPGVLQPYLADMLRRSFIAIRGVNIKIDAIEHRTKLRVFQNAGSVASYIGLEIGADCSSCNLDEYMVFNNNKNHSLQFFGELLRKHINKELPPERRLTDQGEVVHRLFSNQNAFEEWVRSAEGVPRDALNILGLAIQIDVSNKISLSSLRKAANGWYNKDKEQAVSCYQKAKDLLYWIIDTVIGNRQSRAFLLNSSNNDALINYLYDSRVLHIIKTNVSGRDEPGVRYNVYAIDYGCYCNLINTKNNPKCLFQAEADDGGEIDVEVPADDYRSIRRAILKLDEFYTA